MLASSVGLSDVAHQEILSEGPVWPALQDIIQSGRIDPVVVGTHGRTSNKKLALGSVAEEVFRMADRAVLTVGRQARLPNVRPQSSEIFCTRQISSHTRNALRMWPIFWSANTPRTRPSSTWWKM
jgi:universal stress protein family protein